MFVMRQRKPGSNQMDPRSEYRWLQYLGARLPEILHFTVHEVSAINVRLSETGGGGINIVETTPPTIRTAG